MQVCASDREQKTVLLWRLHMFARLGFPAQRSYSIEDSLDEIRHAYAITRRRCKQDTRLQQALDRVIPVFYGPAPEKG